MPEKCRSTMTRSAWDIIPNDAEIWVVVMGDRHTQPHCVAAKKVGCDSIMRKDNMSIRPWCEYQYSGIARSYMACWQYAQIQQYRYAGNLPEEWS